MADQQNWRTGTDANDYFLHQKKQIQMADRRPVMHKASDLVGPGIDRFAARIDDFNSIKATFDGYFSALSTAFNAPSATENFVGVVTADESLGGVQTFWGLSTGTMFRRVFNRNAQIPEFITYTAWTQEAAPPVPPPPLLLQSGVATLSFLSATSASATVTFPTAFPAGVTPVVVSTHVGGGGMTTGVQSITETGFLLSAVYAAGAITGSFGFGWIAHGE